MNTGSELAEKLANLHVLYHYPVYPLSEDAKKGLLRRIKSLSDRLEKALAAEGRAQD